MTEPFQSFSQYLELSKEELFPTLLDQSAFDELLEIGNQFPADISNFWGFEYRLGETQKKADFLFEIKKNSSAHELLLNLANLNHHKQIQQSPIWQQLTAFARPWHDENHVFNQNLRNIWLEFDTATISSNKDRNKVFANPCVFWGPESNSKISVALLDNLIPVMNSLAQVEMTTNQLQFLQEKLPEKAQIFQIGVMSSRQVPMMRVCLNHTSYNAICPLLKQLKWPGKLSLLSSLLESLKPLINSIAIDLDFTTTGIAEKIGLECYMDWSCEDSNQWMPLLNFVADRGLLLTEKIPGILNYPKNKKLDLHDQLANKSNKIVYQNLYQNIHHIKLTYSNNDILEGKVYLGVYRPGLNKELFDALGNEGELKLPKDNWIIA